MQQKHSQLVNYRPSTAIVTFTSLDYHSIYNAGNSQYALDLAVAEVVQAGVAVFVAAGNEDTDACLKSPARYC